MGAAATPTATRVHTARPPTLSDPSTWQTLGVAREAVTRPLQRVPLVETMLASAAATHPGCRLVVLTDEQSVFNFTGPLAEDIEVLRYEVVTVRPPPRLG